MTNMYTQQSPISIAFGLQHSTLNIYTLHVKGD
uniref:Uncharacterized protein n=1 Tax=Anguilla anguilla TaxID=7936 RepID=A0A0E9W5L6_ANGAN